MKNNLWKNLILLILSSNYVYAEKISTLKADIAIGITNNIAVQPCNHLLQNCSIVISQPSSTCLPQSGSITIKNNSAIIAKNIRPYSQDTNFNTYVITNNSCPTNLYPHNSCVISFNTSSPVSFAISNILVKGSNTTATYFDMQAIVCSIPPTSISADLTNVTICTADTAGSPQDITITNNGSDPAMGITATIDPSSGISITNNCNLPLAPGGSCTLTYIPGNHGGLYESSVSGTNTNTVSLFFNQIPC